MRNAVLEHFVGSVASFDALIPNIASAIPLKHQAGFGNLTRTKAKRISDDGLVLAHTKTYADLDFFGQGKIEGKRSAKQAAPGRCFAGKPVLP